MVFSVSLLFHFDMGVVGGFCLGFIYYFVLFVYFVCLLSVYCFCWGFYFGLF